jgi:EAL and modified HD-GYP domain-containing signal transduction protein
MPEMFIARQPIYNRTQHVSGYELLYRSDDENHANVQGGDAATSQTLLNAFTEIGLNNLVGGRAAFINLSRGFLTGKYPLPLPSDRVVIEVLEDVVIDSELIQGVALLAGQGYTIALDDFVYREEAIPLLKLAHIVKLDIQAMSEDDLRTHVATLSEYPYLKLLAEKVEVQEEYEVCRELGFHYFQGYFFSRPRIIKRKRIPNNQVALVQLLAELQRPDVTVPKLETLICRDVGLSYKLLRYINSAFFGLPKPIESIQRAVVFLGTNVIKRWATLLVLSRVDDKPAELMVTAVVRAKMSELLAKAMGHPAEEVCFTVGLLSVLDALLDMEMEKVLAMLAMSDEVNAALLRRAGVSGKILEMVLHYEGNEWDAVRHSELSVDIIRDAYLQAIAWATETCRILIGD